MASVTIRDLDDGVRAQLRLIAAEHGRSMEAELRAIITDHVARHRTRPTIATAAARFRALTGGVDLGLEPRNDLPEIPDLG